MNKSNSLEFAVYFIPCGNLYKTGSEIIGYDIREKSVFRKTRILQSHNNQPKEYGFHLTLTDVVEIKPNQISQVFRRVGIICAIPLFKNIMLRPTKLGIMPNANIYALQFYNSVKLWLLHFLLVMYVQTLGNDSGYRHSRAKMSLWQKIKIKYFLSPYIFDDFLPHISLTSNIEEDNISKIKKLLQSQLFNDNQIRLDTLSVIIKQNDSQFFEIAKAIALKN